MGLTQMNNQPTRKDNILDLYFTNSPTLVRHMEMVPGIGDHDSAIKVDSMIKPMVSQCKPRKIYQYHKGDMTALKADLKDFQDTFLANCDGKSVEELWLSFHSQMMILQEKHIPSKMSKPQTSMPWINGDLKKKIRRNNRLLKSRKKSQKHRSNFLKNRRNLQKQMRQARWDHINGIITQEGDKARKGFWRYVKQFKKDNTGITVLKKDGRSATSPQQKAEMLNAPPCSQKKTLKIYHS